MASEEVTYEKIREDIRESIPESIRAIILELQEKSLWKEIGEKLSTVPITKDVDKFKLIELIKNYLHKNNIGYLELSKELQILKEKGYIHIEERGTPNYFLTPKFEAAIRITKTLDEKIILPTIRELKDIHELEKYGNLDYLVRLEIYSVLK